MNPYFAVAGILASGLGIVHSYLGEKYLVGPILQSDQSFLSLSGNVGLKKVALRITWHFATIALWGAAATLFFLASVSITDTSRVVARLISLTFAAYTLLVFVTPGLRLSYLTRHWAWLAFAAIGALSWLGALK